MFSTDAPALSTLLGKLVFSRVKYLQSHSHCTSIPALLWLTEQVQPKKLVAIHCSSTVYFALCQALEKLNIAGVSSSVNSALLEDVAAYAYHQQQYQDFSQLLPDDTAVPAASLLVVDAAVVATTVLNNKALLAKSVLAVITEDLTQQDTTVPKSSLQKDDVPVAAHFSASLRLGALVIYWQQGEQPGLDYIYQQPEALNLLTQMTQFAAQALRDSQLAAQSATLQQSLSAQHSAYNYLQSDKQLLQQQVEQQAARIERQQAELAVLAQQKQQTEQINTALRQQQQQKEALSQQLEQELAGVQRQNAELSQQHNERIAELVSLTQKLQGFTAQQLRLALLQQENQKFTEQVSQLNAQLAENRLQLTEANEHLTLSQTQVQELQTQYQTQKEQLQKLDDELKQLQSSNKQLIVQYNDMEKQRYLQDYKLLETQRALQQYQHETAQLTLMYQQQQRLMAAAKLGQQALQQQLKQLQQRKSYKLGKVAAKLANPFTKDKAQQQLLRNKALIAQSGWFDASWYLSTYPDVAANNKDPIEHFLKFGVLEGRNPHPQFDSLWYINQYPDVAEQGINPLLHYIRFGQQEGRATKGGLSDE